VEVDVRTRLIRLLSVVVLAFGAQFLAAPSAAADDVGADVASDAAASGPVGPDVIQLPAGFRPEGVAIWRHTFFVGSLSTGAILRGDVRTGRSVELVAGGKGFSAAGIEVDRWNRIWVAGAGTGTARVFDLSSGDLIAEFTLGATDGTSFINDVVVTPQAAYFTDSSRPVLYQVPIDDNGTIGKPGTPIKLGGDYVHTAGFNLNGIEASPFGRKLLAVQTSTGLLFRISPVTGVATKVDLGGALLPNGDGLLRIGRLLYVVTRPTTGPAELVALRLHENYLTASVVTRITDKDFDVPSTVAASEGSLYAVNARFGVPNPDSAPYQIVRVPR
jgi:sugar lactone lactonase YvrE